MKRAMDIVMAVIGLIVVSPVLLPILLLVWIEGRGASPFYIATRVGRGGCPFAMVKVRSMVPNSDKSGVFSTSATDSRITSLGHFTRRYKIDELSQLWNVLIGTMSVVGPRPNVESDVALYTEEERRLLTVRPGITDFSSIIFSDEGEILRDHEDTDLAYNQLIRPWKSRLGLIYVASSSPLLDLQIIFLTALAIISRPMALSGVVRILERLDAPEDVRQVARRNSALSPHAPPGSSEVFAGRA